MARHGGVPSPEACAAEGMVAAVRDVSLQVHTNEILVVMGLSGSGKSTLIRCLSRLFQPTAGAVHFGDREITHLTERQLIPLRRYEMGMVFQNFGLLPNRTVIENVALPLEVRRIARVERERLAYDKIELVGLQGREQYFPRELSGGQQQRVGIARSLVTDPDVWFLDEPFSALDPLIRRDMQDEFLRLQAQLRKSILFITHDFDEAVRLGDRIAIMRDGEVVQDGTPQQILTHPADDYVRQFTRDAPRGSVLQVRAIMEAIDQPGSGPSAEPRPSYEVVAGEPVRADETLNTAAHRVLESGAATVDVVDAGGVRVGYLERSRLLQALFPDDVSETEPAEAQR
ncbi:MAG: ATP-binding cassette domain-containing protein [Spiribacter salinus]|uniref:ATP-binding cassette domain-containing protein n=1 Tax=Spiribacter salinus TaxID=1335746 RepID=A0A540VQV4_9GAMM|nr:MAG: ATP-binding cassette domain-containing protein [Spiribacter salinus]